MLVLKALVDMNFLMGPFMWVNFWMASNSVISHFLVSTAKALYTSQQAVDMMQNGIWGK
jgi:hypothetical protein